MRHKKEDQYHEMKINIRPVRYPKCGRKIMDAGTDTLIRLISPTLDRYPDFVIKCRHYGVKVGVMKTE